MVDDIKDGVPIDALDAPAKPVHGLNDTGLLTNTDPETTEQKVKYPRSIGFIVSNEFCERFSYYGLRTILVFYLRDKLFYDDDLATVVYHTFTVFVYLFPLFGAMIADSWLGKFRTILYLSVVYAVGNVVIALGAVPDLHLPVEVFTIIGLLLVAIGTGGIKPCVSAFGGDQFVLPQQAKQLAMFFSLFYFAVNSGSFISTFVTPILRMDVRCFNEDSCYSLAFGVPGVLMVVSIFIFLSGYSLYSMKKPEGNVVMECFKCVGNAISVRSKQKKTAPRDHWLDYAEEKYGAKFVSEVKAALRVLVLYLPLPVFWALFDQQGSRWTFQASRMNGQMGSFTLKPDQMQVVNPVLILIFIPLFTYVIYPILAKCRISRPLQKLTIGGILAGIAFLVSGIVELELEKTYPVLPGGGEGQFRIFNGFDCNFDIVSEIGKYKLEKLGMMQDIHVAVAGTKTFDIYVIPDGECPAFGDQNAVIPGILIERESTSFFLRKNGTKNDLVPYKDNVDKSTTGYPNVRILSNIERFINISLIDNEDGKVRFLTNTSGIGMENVLPSNYRIEFDGKKQDLGALELGGVYTIALTEPFPATVGLKINVVAEPNSVHMMWLIPQYVIITMGEVMFSVTGLEFSFSQAPLSMKSVLTSFWLLAVCFGNIIVIIVAEAKAFKEQSSEFFLFAGLMFVDMGLFMFLSMRYTYVKTPTEADDANVALQAAPITTKGEDNPTFKNDE